MARLCVARILERSCLVITISEHPPRRIRLMSRACGWNFASPRLRYATSIQPLRLQDPSPRSTQHTCSTRNSSGCDSCCAPRGHLPRTGSRNPECVDGRATRPTPWPPRGISTLAAALSTTHFPDLLHCRLRVTALPIVPSCRYMNAKYSWLADCGP